MRRQTITLLELILSGAANAEIFLFR